MLNFDFLDKGLGIVSLAHFAYDFWDDVWDIGKYVFCNCLLTWLLRQNFKINLTFLIESFLYMTKKSKEKVKYLENKKSF